MYDHASKEPLDIIQANECNGGDLTSRRFQATFNEIERLRAALHKIANEAYTRDDERLTSKQPMMIWQLVAGRALEQKEL